MTNPTPENPQPPLTPPENPNTPAPAPAPAPSNPFAQHPRRWQDFQYVYPVVSRRSKGLSIGINLNIDKACNFDCVYCCVDRTVPPPRRDVDLAQIEHELTRMLDLATSAQIWNDPAFNAVDPALRRINDIAFSGDGEPTAYPKFDLACQLAARAKQNFNLDDTKIVLITNATLLDRPHVQRGLATLDAHNGEVWAKLDAGTDRYYQQIDRTNIPLDKVLHNIAACGRERPIVIQALFMAVHNQPLPDAEFDAFLDRLAELQADGCRIKLVQLYTTARRTAESYVTPLTPDHLDRLAARLRARHPKLPHEVYYGVQ